MAYDLLLGPRRRDFSRAPSADVVLEREIMTPAPSVSAAPSPAHEVSADLLRFYDKYHPRYSGHVFSITTKTDLLKGTNA